jgi:hypothetical protein
MNHNYSASPVANRIRTFRLALMMLAIFICGCFVGGVVTRQLLWNQWQIALKNPESLAARISPQLVSSVGLRVEQRQRVEYLINKRYENMESLRAEIYPLQLAELDELDKEIEAELDGTQRSRWSNLVKKLRNDYLPTAPIAPPTTDFLFRNFDSNNDGILEAKELPPPMWMRVRNADADADGTVSRSEFDRARKLMTE